MSARVVIVPGYRATPADHWFGWLAERFESTGTAVTIVDFPEPEAPNRLRWLGTAADAIGDPDENTSIVAHSLGCLTVLRCIAALHLAAVVGSLTLISGFTESLPALPQLDEFIAGGCDLAGIPSRVDNFRVVRSDADVYVPASLTDSLAAALGVSPLVVPGAGHLLAGDGVTTLPEAFG